MRDVWVDGAEIACYGGRARNERHTEHYTLPDASNCKRGSGDEQGIPR